MTTLPAADTGPGPWPGHQGAAPSSAHALQGRALQATNYRSYRQGVEQT